MKRKVLSKTVGLFLLVVFSQVDLFGFGCCADEGSIKDGKCKSELPGGSCLRETDVKLVDCNRYDSTNCETQM